MPLKDVHNSGTPATQPDDEAPVMPSGLRAGFRFRLAAATIPALLLFTAALLAGLVLLAGCTGTTKQKWLTFFFDGVPVPGKVTNAPPVRGITPVPATNAAPESAAQPGRPKTYLHPPYAMRRCTECHESQFSQKMKGKPGEACFECHKDFRLQAKVKHQPVENGECTSCHNPHQADNTNLLARVGAKLCFDCHDDIPKQLAKAKVKHQPVENGECATCHAPHQSDNKKLLVKPEGKLCFDCHDDLQQQLAKAKIKHQPAENGECSSCHAAHQSDNKKLLVKPQGKLCAECHEDIQQQLAKAKVKHQPVENGECASCHAPHQSDNKKLLIKPGGKL